MKKFYTSLTVAAMTFMMAQSPLMAQTRPGNKTSVSTSVARPGKASSTNNVTRPGQSNVRPGASASTGKPSKHNKPSYGSAGRPGNSSSFRPGTTNINRPGQPTIVRPGVSSRPNFITPPSRPNRLPVMNRPIPRRPATLRPGAVAKFRNTILGLRFGFTLTNSLNYLYNSNYNVDGYGSDEIYLRNVTEMGYAWTDATLFYSNGSLYQSMFYESTIGYNTSRFYGIYNRLRSIYGNPISSTNNGRNLSSTWWCYDGEYITLEYSQLNSSNGYRYFTILTYGR